MEQKAPVIVRMFRLWPGDRVNRLTPVLVGGERGRGCTLQARACWWSNPFTNKQADFCKTNRVFFGVSVQQMDERPHPQFSRDRGGPKTQQCRRPALPGKRFLWRVEASRWGRVQKEMQTKPGKKARQDVHAADAYKLRTALAGLAVEA